MYRTLFCAGLDRWWEKTAFSSLEQGKGWTQLVGSCVCRGVENHRVNQVAAVSHPRLLYKATLLSTFTALLLLLLLLLLLQLLLLLLPLVLEFLYY